MTDRKRNAAELKRLRRQAVTVDFGGGKLTSDGGLLLLREADQKLNLIDRVAQAIPDPRDPIYTVHQQHEMLTSRIFGIAAGYEDGNDHHALRHDPAFQVAAGRTPSENEEGQDQVPLASPATLSRLENRVTSQDCLKISEILVDVFLESYNEPPAEIILDYDATDDTIHGQQEQLYFNGFYRGYCFLPLEIFCGNHMLVSYLRSSRFGAAHNARAITHLLVQKIRSRWPQTKIILRGDSGFANERLMRWCDENQVGYVFGFAQNNVVNRKLACTMTRAKIAFGQTQTKQRRFTWFSYKARRWDRHRWVVGKAEVTAKGTNPRFVVTNLPEAKAIAEATYCPVESSEQFYDEMYCPRGDMENRIKELKLGLFSDRTSCTNFIANQFRLLLSSLAYVLLDGIRRIALKNTKAARWQVDTIRLRLLKIAARVKVTCRRVAFHLASFHPNADVFKLACQRLCRSG